MKYLCIIGGIIGMIAGAVLMYKGEERENSTVQINVKEAESKKSSALNGMFIQDDS